MDSGDDELQLKRFKESAAKTSRRPSHQQHNNGRFGKETQFVLGKNVNEVCAELFILD
jgi:hypothetical protein